MKRIGLVILILVTLLLAGCGNKTLFDTTYTFNTAIITLPDGNVIKGNVESWTDYKYGDQIQVKIDSKVYLVHSSNIALITG